MSKYNNFDTFIKGHLGKAQDYDGVAGCQCIDLIKYYLDEVFDIKPGAWGDAHAYYDNFNNIAPLKNNFTRIANTPSFVPKKGDIMVWSGSLSSGGWGHVALCTGEGTTNYFYSYDNNWTGNHDATAKIKHNYNYVLGVLRPKDQSKVTGKTTNSTSTSSTTNYSLSTPAKGIDVSTYQGNNIDFNKVKAAGYDFVILRAGYGKYENQKDNTFDTNYKKARAAGLNVGAYWYSYATNANDATLEGKVFAKILKGKKFEYPVFLDIEDSSQVNLSKSLFGTICKNFFAELKDYYTGIYSYTSFLNSHIPDEILKTYDVWVAHFDVDKPSYSKPYKMWQYSSKGKVNGISGDVDLDYSYVNYSALIKDKGLNGFTKDTSTDTTYTTYYVNVKDGINSYVNPNGAVKNKYAYGSAIKIDLSKKYPTDKYTYAKDDKGYYLRLEELSKTKPNTSTNPTYTINKTYTLQVDLKVRTGPGTNYPQVQYKNLTADGKTHAYNQTQAIFKRGTKITVLEVKKLSDKTTFVRCPSGWLAAIYNGEIYIK